MTRAELHFQLLPGLDDGPRTMDETVELAELVEDGVDPAAARELVDVAPRAPLERGLRG